MRGSRKSGSRRLILLMLLLALGAGVVLVSLGIPYRGFSGETFLDIPKGASSASMADQLARAGVIRFAWQFLAVRALRPGARLEAGEYQFKEPASVWTVFRRIERGDVFFYSFTVPEGSNLFDIADSVEQLGIMKSSDFLRAARNPALIHDLAPGAPTLEGYLFPSTYRLTRHLTPKQLCRLMTGEFRRQWAALAPDSRVDVNAAVTLASLVEKETALPKERPIVASVYRNRLRKGMTLDCDPTTIYAALLERRYRGTIFRSDLQSANAYNTYRHSGLPPGPIANPGMASLEAALHPAATDFLFFVAKPDGSGGHTFSTDLAQHNLAVRQYRRGLQKPNQESDHAHPSARVSRPRAAAQRH